MGADLKVGYVTTDYAAEGTLDKGVGGMVLMKANYFPLGLKESFRPYFGGVLGGGILFHAWEVDEALGKTDTFQHGYVMAGGAFGFLVGSESVSFYLNFDAIFVFPEKSTFHVDVTAGLALSF